MNKLTANKISHSLRKFLKIIAFIILFAFIALGSLAVYIQFFSGPTYKVEEVHPERLGTGHIEMGEKIVSNLCISCHLSENGDLSGKVLMDHPNWGYITTGNLTRHPGSRVSQYTDGELFYFLKTGVKHNGKMAFPMMPKFATMSDQDINSIIAFLHSDHEWLKPAANTLPPSNPSFFLKALMKFEIKPVPFDNKPVHQVNHSEELEYGSYLVNGRYACFECHSRSTEKLNYLDPPSSPGYLAGGARLNVYGSEIGIRSANITPHPENGIGRWTFEEFLIAITQGERPDGKRLRPPMNRMVLDSIEARSIWKYLKTVEPSDFEWEYLERMETGVDK